MPHILIALLIIGIMLTLIAYKLHSIADRVARVERNTNLIIYRVSHPPRGKIEFK